MTINELTNMQLHQKITIETGLEGLEIVKVYNGWIYKFSYFHHDQDTPYLVVLCFIPKSLDVEALNEF